MTASVEELVEEALALLVLAVRPVVGVDALGGLGVEAVLLVGGRLLLAVPGHLAHEVLLVVVDRADHAALVLEYAVELATVQPDAAAAAAGVDADAAAVELHQLAAAGGTDHRHGPIVARAVSRRRRRPRPRPPSRTAARPPRSPSASGGPPRP